MAKVRRSEYIIASRVICRTLFSADRWGTGSMYFDNLAKGLCDRDFARLNITKDKVEAVLEALVQQRICKKKKKKYGWKYFLNMKRYDKIKQIIREQGADSIIPVLLLLA